uniref:Transmembrane protein n=1 Tax=Arundo donax TaxID=35708 RepID=A0A0A9FHI6_ARUDO
MNVGIQSWYYGAPNCLLLVCTGNGTIYILFIVVGDNFVLILHDRKLLLNIALS